MQKNKIPEIVMEHEFTTIPLTVLLSGSNELGEDYTTLSFNNIFYYDHHVYLPERQSVNFPEHHYAPHMHDGVEMLCITRGEAYLALEGHDVIKLKKGDIAFVNPFAAHTLHGIGSYERICITFLPGVFAHNTFGADNVFDKIVNNELALDSFIPAEDEISPLLYRLMLETVEAVKDKKPGWTLLAQGNIYSILYRVISNNRCHVPASSDSDPQFMRLVIRHINSGNLCELSSNTIASLVGYSDAYFCRKFKSVFKQTFTDFITYHKIMQAKRLLDESDGTSIIKVSEKLGFSHPSYFTNRFKRVMGISPSEYLQSKKTAKRFSVN